MIIHIGPGTRQEGSLRAAVINLWKVRLHKRHCGDTEKEQVPQPSFGCSSKQKTPRRHPFLSARQFKGKTKVLDSTKVAVRSRKELERKMAIEIFIILSHKWPCWTPAFLSVRDSPSHPVGSQPLHSHQMPAASMAHGKFLMSRSSRKKGEEGLGSVAMGSQNHLGSQPQPF